MNAPTRAPESTALSTAVGQPAYRVASPTGRDLILQADNLNAIVRVSELMAKSGQAVPRHLRNNPGACFAVTLQAMRWNMDPYALGLKTYTTDSDAPIAYEGQAIIAALNNSPLLATRLSFQWDGQWERIVGRFKEVESRKKDASGNPILDTKGQPKKYIVPDWDFNKDEEGLSVTVSALLVGETKPRELTLLMKQARTRNSPLWTEDPKQQLAYLAGRRWGRLHAPDVIMGVYTPDELEEREPKDMGPADVVGSAVPDELIARAEAAAAKGVASYQEFWRACTHTERALLSDKTQHHERLKRAASDADKNRTVDNPTQRATTAAAPAPTAAPAAAPAEETSGEAASFQPTYARVMEMMNKAFNDKNEVALDIAADWIGEVADPGQRAELAAKHEEYRAQITAGAKS